MKKATLILIIVTILAKITGFLKEVVLSYFYGASDISDIYLISITIPVGIFALVGAAISTCYIPMFTRIEKEFGSSEANRYTNNLINVIILFCTIIIFAGYVFTEQIVLVFASGFKDSALKIAIEFTRISLLSIYAMGVIYVLNGYLQLKNNYVVPVIILLPLNIITIIAIILSEKYTVKLLAYGTLFATFSQMFFLLPFLKNEGFRYNFILEFKNKYIKKMAWMATPVIFGASVNQINVLVDRTIASNIVVGGISALTYANKLTHFIIGIFALTIATIIYPIISRMAVANDIGGFKNIIKGAVIGISIPIIPATIGAIIFSEEIVALLFGRGAFDDIAIMLTASSLLFYSIGMLGFGFREILLRSFYAMQDTRTPLVNAVIGMILNIILNVILSYYFGIGGLALATSIAAIFTSILLFVSLRKKIGQFGIKQISVSFFKILLASLFVGIVSKYIFNNLTVIYIQNTAFLATIGIGTLLYCVIIYFMKIEEINALTHAIILKINKRAP